MFRVDRHRGWKNSCWSIRIEQFDSWNRVWGIFVLWFIAESPAYTVATVVHTMYRCIHNLYNIDTSFDGSPRFVNVYRSAVIEVIAFVMIKIPSPREKMCEKTRFIAARCDNRLIRFNFAEGLSIALSNKYGFFVQT